jgi:hypothetical protein
LTNSFQESGCTWPNEDPTTISQLSVRLYDRFETLLCSDPKICNHPPCITIKRYHGSKVFLCPYRVCYLRNIRFELRERRDHHARCHERPFRCTSPSCEFSDIGFITKHQLDTHWTKCHHDKKPKPGHLPKIIEKAEIQPLLLDLIAMGNLEGMENLINDAKPYFKELGYDAKRQILKLAAFNGPQAMVELLFDCVKPVFGDDGFIGDIITEAVRGGNTATFKWALPKSEYSLSSIENPIFTTLIIELGNEESFDFWIETFPLTLKTRLRGYSMERESIAGSILLSKATPVRQLKLVDLWKKRTALGFITQDVLDSSLIHLALWNQSVILAKGLISSGANLEFGYSHRGINARTPLLAAAERKSREAALFMKLLLLSGADAQKSYEIANGRRKGQIIYAHMLPGAKNIHQWLGMTWEELVEWAKQQREKGLAEQLVESL